MGVHLSSTFQDHLLADDEKIILGDDGDVQLYWDGTDFVTLISGTIRVKQQAAQVVYQENTTIDSTGTITIKGTGNLVLAPITGDVVATSDLKMADDVRLAFGAGLDIAMINRSTALSADAEISNIIEGTSNHQGVTANSLVTGSIADDGDMIWLVSDGGNSLEMLKFTAATAEVSLGWGALKIGFGPDLTAITRPASVGATAAEIITALINLGLFTA